MTLDLIVPHYREPWIICEFLFNSITTQINVDFKKLRVIVVNDGDDCLIDEERFKRYPFQIDYYVKEHSGVSATRNYGLEKSTADYVMFIDIDDGFWRPNALDQIFQAMEVGFDMLYADAIVEEPDSNKMAYRQIPIPVYNSGQFIRRAFLDDKKIRWDPEVSISEDGLFYTVCSEEAKRQNTLIKMKDPYFIYRYNWTSTMRSKGRFCRLIVYPQELLSRKKIINEFKKRGFDWEANYYGFYGIIQGYYDFQLIFWNYEENELYRKEAEKAYSKYLKLYKHLYDRASYGDIATVSRKARDYSSQYGIILEHETLADFIKRAENDFK